MTQALPFVRAWESAILHFNSAAEHSMFKRALFQLATRGFASHAGRQGEIVDAVSNAHRHLPGSVLKVRLEGATWQREERERVCDCCCCFVSASAPIPVRSSAETAGRGVQGGRG